MLRLSQKQTVWSDVHIEDPEVIEKVKNFLKTNKNPNLTVYEILEELELDHIYHSDPDWETSDDMTPSQNSGYETIIVMEGDHELYNNYEGKPNYYTR